MRVKKINPEYENYTCDEYAPIGMKHNEPVKYIYEDVSIFSKAGMSELLMTLAVAILCILMTAAIAGIPFSIIFLVLYEFTTFSIKANIALSIISTIIACGVFAHCY